MNKFSPIFFIFYIFLLDMNHVQANGDFNVSGGNKLQVTLDSEYGYIDNYLYDNSEEKSTNYFKISPHFFMQAQYERLLFQIDAQTAYQHYDSFSSDNHGTYKLQPRLYYRFSTNKTLYVKVESEEVFVSRGTEISLGEGEDLKSGDTKDSTGFYTGYLYGSNDSVAKLGFNLSANKQEYNTRRDETYIYDYKEYSANANFDYLVSGKTYLALDTTYTKVEYKNDPIKDADKYLFMAGGKWETSSATRLDVLLGYQKINFEEDNNDDYDSFTWRVLLNWKPLNYTHINFSSGRGFEASNRNSDSYRVADKYNLNIKQYFTDYFMLDADTSYNADSIYTTSEEIVGETKDTEDYLSARIKFRYIRNQWLDFYVGYEYSTLDSSIDTDDYDRNILNLGMNISFD